jgi:hypothetical protein
MRRQKITQLELLSGWKDIASYLGKGVRTVQRYERELALPIRRPAGISTGSVIATKTEIDSWISAAPLRKAFRQSLRAADTTENLKGLSQQVTEMHRLCEIAAQLRNEMSAARRELMASLQLLQESLALAAGDPQLSSRRRTAHILTFDPKRQVN